MAKRKNIGVLYKGQNGRGDSIKITLDVALKKGQYVNLENEATALKGLDIAVSKGLDAEYAETLKEKVREEWNKPFQVGGRTVTKKDIARFDLVVVDKTEK